MGKQIEIRLAHTEAEIAVCRDVMLQLRPHVPAPEFVTRVRRQVEEGFNLAYLTDEGVVRALAGYRIMNLLFSGKTLYVDDLVTEERCRSRGYGQRIMEWVAEQARLEGCDRLTLDSGVERFDAHRFYHRMGMAITAHHFTWKRPL